MQSGATVNDRAWTLLSPFDAERRDDTIDPYWSFSRTTSKVRIGFSLLIFRQTRHRDVRPGFT
jgi:hypothetical protein